MFGLTQDFSLVYFNPTLKSKLNCQLDAFVQHDGKLYHGLDPGCLRYNPETAERETVFLRQGAMGGGPQQPPPPRRPELSPRVVNKEVTVKELLTENTGMLESLDKAWRCYFTSNEVRRFFFQFD